MKPSYIWKVVGVVGLTLCAGAAILYLDRFPTARLASLVGITLTVSDGQEPTPSVTPLQIQLAEQLPGFSLGTVAIQTFSGPQLIRSGVGTLVTSDGLIVTTTAGAPFISGSSVYQVLTATGGVYRAIRVAYDAPSGLVLLKTDTADLPGTVTFSEGIRLRAGDTLSAVSATSALSRYAPVVLPMAVVYAIDERQTALSLDRNYLSSLAGARVIDTYGRTIGLLRMEKTPNIISGAVINGVVQRYLSSLTR
jgi:S1-C subfamily serine protease